MPPLYSDLDFMKKTVLITGITGGIGSAIALQFAKEGWNVLGQYHSSPQKMQALKEAIGKFKGECSSFRANFVSKTELGQFINHLKKYKIDSLVNNAGGYVAKRHFEKLTAEDLIDTFMLNTFAPILIATHLFVQMQKRKYGRIVNISSIAAKYGGGFTYSMHYGCAKRALEGLTKTLARQGAKDNILVNTIRPGVIDTDFHKKTRKDINKRIGLIPLQKMGKPEDIAKMVFYLASDQNEFITNEIVTVAGGE